MATAGRSPPGAPHSPSSSGCRPAFWAGSFALSFVPLGAAGLPVAIAIAALKAALVVFFFMDLAHEALSIKLTLLAAGALGVLLGSFMIADIVTRDRPAAFVPGAPHLPMR